MSETMTEVEFRAWEAQQQLQFTLIDGHPVRLPDADQAQSRLARVRQIAGRVLADRDAADAWMRSPQAALGGLEPEALAVDSEDGCQLVLRELVRLGRRDAGAND